MLMDKSDSKKERRNYKNLLKKNEKNEQKIINKLKKVSITTEGKD